MTWLNLALQSLAVTKINGPLLFQLKKNKRTVVKFLLPHSGSTSHQVHPLQQQLICLKVDRGPIALQANLNKTAPTWELLGMATLLWYFSLHSFSPFVCTNDPEDRAPDTLTARILP